MKKVLEIIPPVLNRSETLPQLYGNFVLISSTNRDLTTMTTEYDERKHLLDSNLHKELSIKFRCRFLPTTSLVSARFVAEKMARVAAFVVFMTVLLRLCVQPSHVS